MDVSLWHGVATKVHPKTSAAPPIKDAIDGNPEKLAFFLNQTWSHLDQHEIKYADDKILMDTIVANLKGETVEWMTTLHDEGAPELGILLAFLGELSLVW